MNVLISGGAKNGKSMYAQRLAKAMAEEAGRPLYYIATMIPGDEEDRARIRRHREERAGWGFATLERGRDLCGLLAGGESPADRGAAERSPEQTETADARPQERTEAPAEPPAGQDLQVDPKGAFLLDSVTALLGNEMFSPDGAIDLNAPVRVADDCARFAKATGSTVFVSDYIYGDGDEYDELTEAYRKGLAMIDRRLAEVCDRVVEISAGTAEEWKVPPESEDEAPRGEEVPPKGEEAPPKGEEVPPESGGGER